MSKREGQSNLMREMKSWRQNKTENWKLGKKNELIDKQLASRKKVQTKEAESVYKEFERRSSKASPSVEEYLEKSFQRTEDLRARERAILDRRYKSNCKKMQRDYKQLKLPELAEKSLERGIMSVSFADDTAQPTESHYARDRADSTVTNEETVKLEIPNEDVEDDTEDIHEEHIGYIGRRRFTLAALNQIPEETIALRRSSTGCVDLKAILTE